MELFSIRIQRTFQLVSTFFMTYIQPFNISIGFLHQVQFRKIQRGKILM